MKHLNCLVFTCFLCLFCKGIYAFELSKSDTRVLFLELEGAQKKSIGMAELLSYVGPEIVEVYDNDFKAARKYWALDFRLLLAGLGYKKSKIMGFGEASFICDDGYTVNSDVNSLYLENAKPFLAIGSAEDIPSDKLIDGRWEPYLQGRNWIGFDPFYLIWTSEDASFTAESASFPWPYQLATVKFSIDSIYKTIEPANFLSTGDTSERIDSLKVGFQKFTDHCIRCHQVAGIGGTLGPDILREHGMLSVLDTASLVKLITDVTSFYPQTAMPDFSEVLSKNEAENIVSYLHLLSEKIPKKPPAD